MSLLAPALLPPQAQFNIISLGSLSATYLGGWMSLSSPSSAGIRLPVMSCRKLGLLFSLPRLGLPAAATETARKACPPTVAEAGSRLDTAENAAGL